MPSFVIHTVCGDKILKHLDVSNDDKIKFLIGNILPDTDPYDIPSNLDELQKRLLTQKMKKSTHFRTEENVVIQVPNLNIFLDKYEDIIKSDINALAYFFHLYTDRYYFTKFLPKFITFYDKNNNKALTYNDVDTVLIHKDKRVMKRDDFWSKSKSNGLYADYSRSNNYLLKQYPLSFNINELKEYLKYNEYYVDIKEINCNKAMDGINSLERVIELSKTYTDELTIFTIDMLSSLIEEVYNSFMEEYGYLLNNYKKEHRGGLI